jgi:hypothetical protein
VVRAAAIASITDAGGSSRTFTAKDLLAPDLQVVYPGDDLYSTLDIFRRLSVDVLPVVEEGEYLGMLSRSAILKALRKRLADQRYHLLQEHSGLTALAQESLIESLLSEISSHAGGRVQRMDVPDDVVGKSLKDSGFRERYESQVIAIQKPSGELITGPSPEFILLREDTLIVFKEHNGEHS